MELPINLPSTSRRNRNGLKVNQPNTSLRANEACCYTRFIFFLQFGDADTQQDKIVLGHPKLEKLRDMVLEHFRSKGRCLYKVLPPTLIIFHPNSRNLPSYVPPFRLDFI